MVPIWEIKTVKLFQRERHACTDAVILLGKTPQLLIYYLSVQDNVALWGILIVLTLWLVVFLEGKSSFLLHLSTFIFSTFDSTEGTLSLFSLLFVFSTVTLLDSSRITHWTCFIVITTIHYTPCILVFKALYISGTIGCCPINVLFSLWQICKTIFTILLNHS